MKKSTLTFLMLLVAFISVNLSGHNCGATEYDDDAYEEEYDEEYDENVWDPIEPLNQITFRFNDFLYKKAMDPLSDAYVFIIPTPIRTGISNFMHNITAPKRFVGAIMQLKPEVAMTELGKFVINSSFGLGGVLDVAKIEMDDEEDIGQGFAYWGIPSGPYIVWPFLGSSNLRDSIGIIGEFCLHPVSYVENPTQIAIRSLDIVNEWPTVSDGYDAVTEDAIDPYTAMKDAYEQFRNKKIRK